MLITQIQLATYQRSKCKIINDTIIACDRHPNVIICSIRWSKNLTRWQDKTVGKKVVRLANDLFDLNVAWQFTDFYSKKIKLLKDDKRAKTGRRPLQPGKRYHLSVGHKTGETELPVHIERNVDHEIKFNYL